MRRFDADQARTFVTALRAALSDEDAAAYAGIDPATLRRWLRRDAFGAEVRRVKAERALAHAGRVAQVAREDWRAALMLAQLAAQERELARLRELTTDARP